MTLYVVDPSRRQASDSNSGLPASPWATTAAIGTKDKSADKFVAGDEIEIRGRHHAPFKIEDSDGHPDAPIIIRGPGGELPLIHNRELVPRGQWVEQSPGLWRLTDPFGHTGAWVGAAGGYDAIEAHGPSKGNITDRDELVHQWVGNDLEIWTAPRGGIAPDALLGELAIGSGDAVEIRRSHVYVRDLEGQFVDHVVRFRSYGFLEHQVGVVAERIYASQAGGVAQIANNGADAYHTRGCLVVDCYGENLGGALVQTSNGSGGGLVIRRNTGRRIGQIYSTGGIYLGGGTSVDDEDEWVFVIENDLDEVYARRYFNGDGHGVEIDNTVRRAVIARNRISRVIDGNGLHSNAGKFENWFIGNVLCNVEDGMSITDAQDFASFDLNIIGNTFLNVANRGVNCAHNSTGELRIINNAFDGLAGAGAAIRLASQADPITLVERGNVITDRFAEAIDDNTTGGYTLDPSSTYGVAGLDIHQVGRWDRR